MPQTCTWLQLLQLFGRLNSREPPFLWASFKCLALAKPLPQASRPLQALHQLQAVERVEAGALEVFKANAVHGLSSQCFTLRLKTGKTGQSPRLSSETQGQKPGFGDAIRAVLLALHCEIDIPTCLAGGKKEKQNKNLLTCFLKQARHTHVLLCLSLRALEQAIA